MRLSDAYHGLKFSLPPLTLKRPAEFASTRIFVRVVNIARCVFVAARAVRLGFMPCCVDGAGDPSSNIDRVSYRLQVLRVNATPDAAFVVDLQSLWYRPIEQFIGYAVRGPFGDIAPIESHPSISVMRDFSQPQPAAGIRFWGNKFHESFKYAECSHATLLSCIGQGCAALVALLRPAPHYTVRCA